MLTIDQQANRWVVRLHEHGLSPAEQEALDAWCAQDRRHRGAYARALAIHRSVVKAAAGAGGGRHAGAAAGSPAPRRSGGHGRLMRYGGLAASIAAVLAAALLYLQPHSVTYATAIGEFRKVPLADQSIANINSGSQVEVTLTGQLRQVSLVKGEVWFEVAKDKSRPFVVEAGTTHVRAVGTSFGVNLHDGVAEVLVTEGVVEVWRSGSEQDKTLLAAGEHAVVAARQAPITVRREPAEIARKLAWREGKLVLVNESLAAAAAEFNRYSRKQIVVADPVLARKTLVGQYRIDDPELFARAVGAFLDVPVAVTHERIIIGDVRLLKGLRAP